jgi:Uma2 family endonuclease
MADPAPRRMSLAEFYDWNPPGDTRYQLIEGTPVAMAPAGGPHQVMAGTVARKLGQALDRRPGCAVRIEAGIVPPWRRNTYYQADLAVSCRPVEQDWETKDPILIVEILSPSTEDDDRKVKLPDYRRLPSVEEIVLIDPNRLHCEVYRRRADGGWLHDLLVDADARLRLESVGLDIPLLDVYVNLPALEAAR